MRDNLVENIETSRPSVLVAQLNARLQPIHRGRFFEDPLSAALERAALGQITGGGTLQDVTGEIQY